MTQSNSSPRPASPTCPDCGHLASVHDNNVGCHHKTEGKFDCNCRLTARRIRHANLETANAALEAANALLAQRVTDLEAALRDARHDAFSEAVELAYRESPRLQNVNDAIKLLIALRDMAGVS